MLTILISILFVYVFIILGFVSKMVFKEEMNTKTLTILSVYFFQPFVALWGFTSAPLKSEHLSVALIYMVVIVLTLVPIYFIGKKIFTDPKERSIFTIAGFVGNTGNIGIPLGIALFGQESVIYTTTINLANVFVVYIIGVYIYSRGKLDIRASLLNILKIPIIPISLFAIALNLSDIKLHHQIIEFIKIGAYGGIALQLFLLGVFLYRNNIKESSKKLIFAVLGQKFLLLPLVGAFILSFSSLDLLVKAIIVMQLSTPLAVANINLASLYDCKPHTITSLIVISTVLFLPILFGLIYIINTIYL